MVADPGNVDRHELLGTFTNERGQKVSKFRIRDERSGRTKGIQYKVSHNTAFMLLREGALMDLADLLDDACNAIEDAKFPEEGEERSNGRSAS